MDRQYYLDLAAAGLSMPIITDLVLHEHDDHAQIALDGARLGQVLAETARRLRTPLAMPHMDLELEKVELLHKLGVPDADAARYHFEGSPGAEAFAMLKSRLHEPLTPRLQAHVDSVAYVAKYTELLPVGMCIGPFSLATKLVADPITPIGLAGAGLTAEDDPEIKAIEDVLELGIRVILHSIAAQAKAGARAIFIAEPAANVVYFSPRQMEAGADIFERYVMSYNRQIKAFLDELGVDLIFHCCGELTDAIVSKFAELDPCILSLGSSRRLWEDARLLPKDIVLFGNLPSKQFYSDSLITRADVVRMAANLRRHMRAADHPFILGTECDVLSVPGCEWTISKKVMALLERETVRVGNN